MSGKPQKYDTSMVTLGVRMHPDDKERLKREAEKLGVSLTDLARERLVNGLGDEGQESGGDSIEWIQTSSSRLAEPPAREK